MNVGVVFPQTEIGTDPHAIREYAIAIEELGYTHLLAFDHVLGADVSQRTSWAGKYRIEHAFHEPLMLFAHLAAVTSRLGFVTGVLVLPQRQTVLVAKQAAELDLLCGGRLRLGVGIGWNAVEYEALGEEFHDRGAREEEQIGLLRALWSQPVVTFRGRWHAVSAAGLNPRPIQKPIPIWLGGKVDAAYRRIARLADGWMPQFRPDAAGASIVRTVREYAVAAGRDPETLGLEARLNTAITPRHEWISDIDRWKSLGATHLSVNTLELGLRSLDEHIAILADISSHLNLPRRTRHDEA